MAKRNIDMVSPNRAQGLQYAPMVRQSSLYNLTFDDVQRQSGNTMKPLHHSLNLDELQKNVISAESGPFVQDPSSDPPSFIISNIGLNSTFKTNISDASSWRGIVHHEQVNRSIDSSSLQHPSLGETTTFESFLRTGMFHHSMMIDESQPFVGIEPMVMPSQQEHWFQMQIPSINNMHHHQQQQQQQQQRRRQQHEQQHQQIIGSCPEFNVSKTFYENSVMEIGYTENSMGISMPSPPCSDCKSGVLGKNKFSDEVLERTIERRQKRMAKNRESAARSRAKKQEHINRLEKDKYRLQKMNTCLKKTKRSRSPYSRRDKDVQRSCANENMRYIIELDSELFSTTIPTPRYQLRRTSSTTF